MSIKFEINPADEDVQMVHNGLVVYNEQALGTADSENFACFIRNAAGQVEGGATGWYYGQMAMVRLFWVDEKLRGQGVGRRIFEKLEIELKSKNICEIHLDTYSVQAPEFYKKIGFIEVARIPFMKKLNVEKIFFIKDI